MGNRERERETERHRERQRDRVRVRVSERDIPFKSKKKSDFFKEKLQVIGRAVWRTGHAKIYLCLKYSVFSDQKVYIKSHKYIVACQ